MIPKAHIRLALYTDLGPCGPRLERGIPLPTKAFDFPDTERGRIDALNALEALNNYMDKYHIPKSKKG